VDTSLYISFTVIPCTKAQQSGMWNKYFLCTLIMCCIPYNCYYILTSLLVSGRLDHWMILTSSFCRSKTPPQWNHTFAERTAKSYRKLHSWYKENCAV